MNLFVIGSNYFYVVFSNVITYYYPWNTRVGFSDLPKMDYDNSYVHQPTPHELQNFGWMKYAMVGMYDQIQTCSLSLYNPLHCLHNNYEAWWVVKSKASQDEHNLYPSQLLVDYCSRATQFDNLTLVTHVRLLILFCRHHAQATRIRHDKAEIIILFKTREIGRHWAIYTVKFVKKSLLHLPYEDVDVEISYHRVVKSNDIWLEWRTLRTPLTILKIVK